MEISNTKYKVKNQTNHNNWQKSTHAQLSMTILLGFGKHQEKKKTSQEKKLKLLSYIRLEN